MTKRYIILFLALSVAVLYFGFGCDRGQEEKPGVLKLNITDAPGDYDEVFITFTEVSVHKSGSGDNETDDDDNATMRAFDDTDNETDNDTDNETNGDDDDNDGDDDDEGDDDDDKDGDDDDEGDDDDTDNDTDDAGWIIVSDEEQGFDLLQLQDGKFELLAEAELDTGKYTQIRLKITDELDEFDKPKTYVMVDGEKYALTVPSGTKSGLKLTHGFTIESDTETVLYIDFDADKSVNQTGNGEYKLKPTIKVMTELP